MPPKTTDPRKQHRGSIDGFRSGSSRYIGQDGKYQEYTGQYDIHVTMDSMPKPYIDTFHISVYFFPHWTRENDDTTGKTKVALWGWRWNPGSSSYVVTPDTTNKPITAAALSSAQKLARKMQTACFASGAGKIDTPTGTTLPPVKSASTTKAETAAQSTASSTTPSIAPESSRSSSPPASRSAPGRRASASQGWKTVSLRPGRQDMADRRRQRDSKAAAFAAAVPADSPLGKWLHAPRDNGTRDERGRGTWQEESAENAAREALQHHHDFDAAERLLGRAITLRQRPPEGVEEDDDRAKPVSRLTALRSDVRQAKTAYAQALNRSK